MVEIFSYDEVYKAYRECSKNKRHTPNAALFEIDENKKFHRVMTANPDKEIQLSFFLEKTMGMPKGHFYVSGNHKDLGDWEIKKALRLKTKKRNGKDFYCGSIIVKKNNFPLEYKYFAKMDGQVCEISENMYTSMTGSAEYTADFQSVQDTDALQDGLKSGLYQLCMVDNVKSGALKKNTMMDYFVHRNLCIEKVDTSKREELTAWYNAEQAAISNQENYWDEEISNLSTELTSINTEIDSVKSLKTNAIKSVFGWGSQ